MEGGAQALPADRDAQGSDDPDLLGETLAVAKASQDRAAALAVACPSDIVMIPENLSSEVVGPRLFEEFMRPYQTQWAAAIRRAGKHACIHLDGTLRGLLRQECSVGLSFIEAMTPSPAGHLAVRDWEEFSGDRTTVFWGGLPGIYFTDLVDDAEFDRHVRETLRVMRGKPR